MLPCRLSVVVFTIAGPCELIQRQAVRALALARPRVYVNDTCVFRAAYIITGCQYRALSYPLAASQAVMYALIVRPLRFETRFSTVSSPPPRATADVFFFLHICASSRICSLRIFARFLLQTGIFIQYSEFLCRNVL